MGDVVVTTTIKELPHYQLFHKPPPTTTNLVSNSSQKMIPGQLLRVEATLSLDPGRSNRTTGQRKTIATSQNNKKGQTRTTDNRTTSQGQTIRTDRDLNNSRDLKATIIETTSTITTGTTSTTTTTMLSRNPMSGALQLCCA